MERDGKRKGGIVDGLLPRREKFNVTTMSFTYLSKKKKSMSFTSYDFSNQMWFLGNTLVEKYI